MPGQRPVDDDVLLESIRRIVSPWEGVEEALLQDRPLFRVGRRRFALFNGSGSPARPRWDGCGQSLHFLADPVEAEALRHDPRFAASPHHGDRGWMRCRLDAPDVDWREIAELLEQAYRMVAKEKRSASAGRSGRAKDGG